MMVDHEAYAGQVVMVISQGVKMSETLPSFPSYLRLFTDDWDKDSATGELPPFEGDGPSLKNSGAEEMAKVPPEFFGTWLASHGREGSEKSMQDYMGEATVLGLTEGEHIAKAS